MGWQAIFEVGLYPGLNFSTGTCLYDLGPALTVDPHPKISVQDDTSNYPEI